jgi:hypothetical protein
MTKTRIGLAEGAVDGEAVPEDGCDMGGKYALFEADTRLPCDTCVKLARRLIDERRATTRSIR